MQFLSPRWSWIVLESDHVMLGLVCPTMPRIWILPPRTASIIHPTSHIGAVYLILSFPRRRVIHSSRPCRGHRRVGPGLTAPFLDPACHPTKQQAGDALGAESKTLECQLWCPGIPAARFRCRDLLPVETPEFLKLLDASVVLEGVQPQRPVSSQDAELNLRGVGRKARIQGAAEEVRARMLLVRRIDALAVAIG